MQRLTFDGRFCDLAMCQEPHPCKYHETGCSQRNTWERLKAIEDILGDDYYLDKLRELVGSVQDGHGPAKRKEPVVFTDYVKCIDDDELKNSIRFINESGWRMVGVTFDGTWHYLFFERFGDG